MGKYDKLFTPFNIGSVEIKNRFVMGPMGIGYLNDQDSSFNEDAVAYYGARAKGGFGLIFTGVQLVDRYVDPPMAPSMLNNREAFIEKGKILNDECNKYGSKIILELGYGVGRNYPTFKAPSASPAYNYPTMVSKPLTKKEIQTKRDEIIAASVVGKEAGFAGIDLHSLHWGYLLDQFVLGITNRRTDEYGGSLENRLRLVRESVEGIHRECGADFPVTVGLGVKSYIKGLNQASLTGEDEAGRTLEEAIRITKMLEEMGIAAIMTDTGIYDSFYYACPPAYMPKGHGLELYKQVKDAVSIPVMARSRMGDADLCADTVNNGIADAVVLARPSLADPDFPNKVAEGRTEEIRPCIGCNMGCIGRLLETQEHATCAVNPRAGFERTTEPKTTKDPKKIAVVGGGAAGMQATLTAIECGHKPVLFEKSDHLGGELIAAGADAFKCDIQSLNKWFKNELSNKNADVRLNTEFTADTYKEGDFDLVVMATGASPVKPGSIIGIEKGLTAVDVLEFEKPVGDTVIVVGGGMVGCETAIDIAKKGKKVCIVEALPEILSAEFVPQQPKMMLKDMIAEYGIDLYTNYKLVEIKDDGVVVEVARKLFTLNKDVTVNTSMVQGEQMELKADSVVISLGMRSNPNITDELKALGAEVVEVGSARKPGFILTAVQGGFEAVYNLD